MIQRFTHLEPPAAIGVLQDRLPQIRSAGLEGLAKGLHDLHRLGFAAPGQRGPREADVDQRHAQAFGHRGYVRTALRHDVPIVPVVGQGSHSTFLVVDDAKWLARLAGIDRLIRIKSWPITISFPWGLTFFPPPLYVPMPAKIRMEILPPIHFRRHGEAAARDEAYVAECAALVEARMQETLDRLARE